MRFLLDTNILIHAHDGVASVNAELVAHDGELATSALCLAELRRAVVRDPLLAAAREQKLSLLLSHIDCLSFDLAAVRAYGGIIEQCGFVRGRDFDRMIAGHAISIGATLVTDNGADFSDIPGLAVENWAA